MKIIPVASVIFAALVSSQEILDPEKFDQGKHIT